MGWNFRQRHALIIGAAALSLACGGTTIGGDAGPEAGPDVVASGCGSFATWGFAVDASVCSPQLESTTSCNDVVCSWIVEVPCFGDAGAGEAGDAGAPDCNAWCSAAAPPNVPPSGFCQAYTQDGGTFARCGGCGI